MEATREEAPKPPAEETEDHGANDKANSMPRPRVLEHDEITGPGGITLAAALAGQSTRNLFVQLGQHGVHVAAATGSGGEDGDPSAEPELTLQRCNSCKRCMTLDQFDGKATCNQCRPRKRMRHAAATQRTAAELNSLREQVETLRAALARKTAEANHLQLQNQRLTMQALLMVARHDSQSLLPTSSSDPLPSEMASRSSGPLGDSQGPAPVDGDSVPSVLHFDNSAAFLDADMAGPSSEQGSGYGGGSGRGLALDDSIQAKHMEAGSVNDLKDHHPQQEQGKKIAIQQRMHLSSNFKLGLCMLIITTVIGHGWCMCTSAHAPSLPLFTVPPYAALSVCAIWAFSELLPDLSLQQLGAFKIVICIYTAYLQSHAITHMHTSAVAEMDGLSSTDTHILAGHNYLARWFLVLVKGLIAKIFVGKFLPAWWLTTLLIVQLTIAGTLAATSNILSSSVTAGLPALLAYMFVYTMAVHYLEYCESSGQRGLFSLMQHSNPKLLGGSALLLSMCFRLAMYFTAFRQPVTFLDPANNAVLRHVDLEPVRRSLWVNFILVSTAWVVLYWKPTILTNDRYATCMQLVFLAALFVGNTRHDNMEATRVIAEKGAELFLARCIMSMARPLIAKILIGHYFPAWYLSLLILVQLGTLLQQANGTTIFTTIVQQESFAVTAIVAVYVAALLYLEWCHNNKWELFLNQRAFS